jgi:hypothetical protein
VIFINEEIEKRQAENLPTPFQKALAIEEIKPLTNPTAKRLRMTYGPYKIKGNEVNTRWGYH